MSALDSDFSYRSLSSEPESPVEVEPPAKSDLQPKGARVYKELTHEDYKWNPLLKKSHGIGMTILKGVWWVVSGLGHRLKDVLVAVIGVIPSAVSWAYRNIRHTCIPSIRKELKSDYADLLRQSLIKIKYNPDADNGNDHIPGYKDFKNAIKKFQGKIPNLSPNELREEIVKLSKFKAYGDLKKEENPPAAVKYLQDCGMALESTDGREIFKDYGKAKVSKTDSDFEHERSVSLVEFSDTVESARKDKTFNRDKKGPTKGAASVAAYMLTHVRKYFHIESAKSNPAGYDSYKDHAVFLSEPLVDAGHAIEHKYTPGLTGPTSIVEDVLLPVYKRDKRRWIHIDNQSTHTVDERIRVDLVHEMALKNSDVFFHAVIATDTPAKVAKRTIKKFEEGDISIDQFLSGYESAIRGDDDEFIRDYTINRGIYIPDGLLDKDELDAAFQASRNMILQGCLQEPNSSLLRTEKGRKELAKIAARNLSSVLEWAIMKKEQFHHVTSTFTVNCKENVDRGPFENLGVILNDEFAKALSDAEVDILEQNEDVQMTAEDVRRISGTERITMKPEQVNLQTGIILGRGDFSSDRSPQDKRADPALDRTRFIDRSQEIAKGQLGVLRRKLIKPIK